jgi:hypothetical protein
MNKMNNTQDNSFDPTTKTDTKPENTSAPKRAETAKSAESLSNIDIPNIVDKPFGESSLSEEAIRVKHILAKEVKMPFFIPLEPGEKPGAYRSVTINGYRCEVKKGMMVSLPMSIAKLLMDAYQIESEVLNNNEYNLNNKGSDTRNALNS